MKIIKHDQDGGKKPVNPWESMDRLFDEPFRDPFGGAVWNPFGRLMGWPMVKPFTGTPRFLPSMDISEDDKEMKIVANVPGFNPEDIQVELVPGKLTIRGKTEEEKKDEGRKYFRRERAYGEFYREIALPPYVDAEKAQCKCKNGTLTITMPKEKGANKKHLKIETE